MNPQEKPSLSDVARQNNKARVSKFANSIIPVAPEEETPAVAVVPSPAPLVEPPAEKPVAEEPRPVVPVAKQAVDPASSKPSKKRSGNLSMDDILEPKAPDEEVFPKMTRIATKHHDLLRDIAYAHRKPMNTILYNLLEALDQTYRREQHKDA